MKMWRRLYGDVFEGSMAGRKDALVLFMYLISRADDNGFVRRPSVRVVSTCTGLTPDEYTAALVELQEPDPESRSKELDGRRLVSEDDGWMIVNFEHYQGIQRQEQRRESVRQAVARHRLRKAEVSDKVITPGYRPAEERRGEEKRKEENEKKKDTGTASRSRFVPPSFEEVQSYCRERASRVDPRAWMDHYESNGWRVGRNPMKSWKAAVRTWERQDTGGWGKPVTPPAGPGDYTALEKAKQDRLEWEKENGK